MPSGLWHYEFIAYPSTEARQEWQQAKDRLFSRQECRQAAKFTRPFWWEIGQFCAAASKPSKDHQGQDSVLLHANHWRQNFFLRTLKCYLRWSWACDPEDSKSKPMVWAREHRADGEPSLVVGRGHVSWTMLSLIPLTRQKQLAKSRQAASQPASQC
jgi:hypothetical protein